VNTEVDILVRGRHLEVSQGFRTHVTDKFARITRFGIPLSRVDVEVSRENNPRQSEVAFEVEITCLGSGPVVRAEAAAGDKYAALDLAYGRLEERLRRAADRRRNRRAGEPKVAIGVPSTAVDGPVTDDEITPDDEVYAQGPVLVREKAHLAGQMSVEQALYEMELVGHDFFLFRDDATGRASVVYRRRGYDYGLIRLVEDAEVAVG
jgi:ribosomal subunit interface protein